MADTSANLANSAVSEFLQAVRQQAEQADVFDTVEVSDRSIQCAARASAEPAWYRVEQDGDHWFVALVTPDRWLSESVEAQLMHDGDPIEELVEEELVDLGHEGGPLSVQHFRSDEMLYTFRSRLPIDTEVTTNAAGIAATCLLAYEAAFRELGDMNVADDE